MKFFGLLLAITALSTLSSCDVIKKGCDCPSFGQLEKAPQHITSTQEDKKPEFLVWR